MKKRNKESKKEKERKKERKKETKEERNKPKTEKQKETTAYIPLTRPDENPLFSPAPLVESRIA